MIEKLQDPKSYPAHAAQEILALLVQAGAFSKHDRYLNGTTDGEKAAEAMIAAHKALTAYYKTLE